MIDEAGLCVWTGIISPSPFDALFIYERSFMKARIKERSFANLSGSRQN